MAYNQERELVCFHCGSHTCAVGLLDIEEICINANLHVIPCLPECYSGLYYYKGEIIPVVSLEHEMGSAAAGASESKACVVVLRHASCLLGISLEQEPFILSVGEADKTVNETDHTFSKIWKEKEIFNKDGTLIFVLDIEQIVKNLTEIKVIE